MALIQSDWAKGGLPFPYPQYAGHLVMARFFIVLTTAQLVLNNIFEIAPLPADCVPLSLVLDSDDLDSATAAVLDCGLLSGAWGAKDDARTIGAEFISGCTVAQAGGIVRPALASSQRVQKASTDRSIGVKVATAPGTPVAGVIGLTIGYTTPP